MSPNPFQERFTLMVESDQIQEHIVEVVTKMIRQIEQDYPLTLTEENAGMFVSHVALALQRLIDKESLGGYPPVVLTEAQTMKQQWAYTQKLARWITENLGEVLPEGEIAYLTIHLERLVQETSP